MPCSPKKKSATSKSKNAPSIPKCATRATHATRPKPAARPPTSPRRSARLNGPATEKESEVRAMVMMPAQQPQYRCPHCSDPLSEMSALTDVSDVRVDLRGEQREAIQEDVKEREHDSGLEGIHSHGVACVILHPSVASDSCIKNTLAGMLRTSR